MEAIIQETILKFEAFQSEDDAKSMAAYMKNKFVFLGIRSPQRKLLQREIINTYKNEIGERLMPICKALWNIGPREYVYFACDLLDRFKKNIKIDDIKTLEYLILSNSWWDSVDGVAPRSLGYYFQQYPEMQDDYIWKWVSSEEKWLIRSALLFQLKYKTKTDIPLLFSIIKKVSNTQEFFINKAIGWALRELSKSYSKDVLIFVETNKLSNLSRKEALKYINQ